MKELVELLCDSAETVAELGNGWLKIRQSYLGDRLNATGGC